jgi:hypothetical protein
LSIVDDRLRPAEINSNFGGVRMRPVLPLCLVCILLLVSSTATTQQEICPKIGIYSTQSETMLGGRASEAWCPVLVMPGVPGNAENAQSWDGVNLATEWKLYGMTIDAVGAVLLESDLLPGGIVQNRYSTHYDGGMFWLSKDGDWGDGVNDITGVLSYYNVETTVLIRADSVLYAASDITATGVFDDCRMRDAVVDFVIANALIAWHPGWSSVPMPADYPPFLCGAPGGELFDVCCIAMNFQPAVPIEERSWGLLKAMYQ